MTVLATPGQKTLSAKLPRPSHRPQLSQPTYRQLVPPHTKRIQGAPSRHIQFRGVLNLEHKSQRKGNGVKTHLRETATGRSTKSYRKQTTKNRRARSPYSFLHRLPTPGDSFWVVEDPNSRTSAHTPADLTQLFRPEPLSRRRKEEEGSM